MSPFEGDSSSLSLIAHLLLLNPKVSIFESNDIKIKVFILSFYFYQV